VPSSSAGCLPSSSSERARARVRRLVHGRITQLATYDNLLFNVHMAMVDPCFLYQLKPLRHRRPALITLCVFSVAVRIVIGIRVTWRHGIREQVRIRHDPQQSLTRK